MRCVAPASESEWAECGLRGPMHAQSSSRGCLSTICLYLRTSRCHSCTAAFLAPGLALVRFGARLVGEGVAEPSVSMASAMSSSDLEQ